MKDAIIPYIIIDSLRKIDNIHEMRLFGYVIAKAQAVLKSYNKHLDAINIEHAMRLTRFTMPARYLLAPGDTNYRNAQKAFTLQTKTVSYTTETREMQLNIIAFPEHEYKAGQHYITFVVHQQLWWALRDFTKGHRLINLPIMLRLKSTYSVVMYILCSNQKEPINYQTGTLKRILGVDAKKAYERNSNFIAKVIEPARRELNEKSPYSFDYSLQRSGRGGPYTNIIIQPKANLPAPFTSEEKARAEDLERQRINLAPEVTFMLEETFDMSTKAIERIELQLATIGDYTAQLRWLAGVKEAALRYSIRNRAGYLTEALRNRV